MDDSKEQLKCKISLKKIVRGGTFPRPEQLHGAYLTLVANSFQKQLTATIEDCSQKKCFFLHKTLRNLQREGSICCEYHPTVQAILRCARQSILQKASWSSDFGSSGQWNIRKTQFIWQVCCIRDWYAIHCRKFYEDVLKGLFPSMTWLGWWDNIVDLCGDTWQNHFKLVIFFLRPVKRLFQKDSAARISGC